MRQLIIDNYLIDKPIPEILEDVRNEITNGKLRDIGTIKNDNIAITCPFHKGGHENKPSCQIYVGDDQNLAYGMFRCFTCGEQGSFAKLIGEAFDESEFYGKSWLIKKYGVRISSPVVTLEDIKLPTRRDVKQAINGNSQTFLDEKLLDEYQSWHPYMAKRKLSRQICEQFKVKYDPDSRCLIFPVWDARGNYVFNTKRSVETKQFLIPEGVTKPVYLLNYILSNNIRTVTVVESQINALTLWTHGIPAVALFGTGSQEQYEILKKTPINHYILGFDGDMAGDSGSRRFKKNMPRNVLIEDLNVPLGKDINDLSKEEILKLYQNLQDNDVY